jgi:hypothetical protein
MVKNVRFFSKRATKNFFVLRYFLLNYFSCVVNQVRHIHFTRKISKVQLLPLQTNKNFLLSNFRIFSCKLDVSYNFSQLTIYLETWLRTHEKKIIKKKP